MTSEPCKSNISEFQAAKTLVKTRFVENLVETAVERVAGSRRQLASIP